MSRTPVLAFCSLLACGAGLTSLALAQTPLPRPDPAAGASTQPTVKPAALPTARPLRPEGVIAMQAVVDGIGGHDTRDSLNIRPSRLKVLSAADHDLFARAFDAADRGDWAAARNLAAQSTSTGKLSAVARRLLTWRYALNPDSGADFATITAVITDSDAAGWPLAEKLREEAEKAMPAPSDPLAPSPATIVAWFKEHAPTSGIGKIRLGDALIATGQAERGAKLIQAGWAEGDFDTATEQAIVQRDGNYITPAADRARLDALLWRGQTSAARRLLARMGEGPTADIAQARIALRLGVSRARAELAKVKDSDDPGLLFDWSHALRMDDQDAAAHAMLLKVDAAPMVKDHGGRWWGECNAQARDALAAGDSKTALALVDHCGFTDGVHFAEQEFLAGFISLRFLKEPRAALRHFSRLNEGVGRPISKGRAQYWMGRAYEAMHQDQKALIHYRQAATWPETFYGQVALAHIDPHPMLHLSASTVQAAPAATLDADPLMDAIKVLADLGQPSTLRTFVLHDAATHSDPAHQKRLMMALVNWGFPDIAVRLAKIASYDGVNFPHFTHPLIAIPPYRGPGNAPDPALVLGLIRQETEFNPFAISSAGARGLMQMMPASAKVAARQAGLPYRPGALLDDPAYNMQLGMTEYRGHLDRYGGSLVLAAAAYNAGPTNARRWVARYGDPRDGAVDPIDWIEQIPFAETRNYVQRVLENTEVYRARLAGKDVPLKILDDLYAPASPRMPILTVSGSAPPAGD